jgi:hypothetical protein
MMRSALWVLGVASTAGCAPTVKDCEGNLVGAYAGDLSGELSADLARDGALQVEGIDDADGSGAFGVGTATDATLGFSLGELNFNGSFDPDSCSGAGSWLNINNDRENGTWQLGF